MSERAIRVGEQLRSDLMNILLRGRLRDPAAQDVLVTAVRVSADLQHARVFVRTLTESSERKQRRVVQGLERAAGFLRRELGQNLKIRRTPELSFEWDEAVDRGLRVERILSEIAEEEKAKPGEEAESESEEAGNEC